MPAVTHRCAVLGAPITHSLSPVLHRAAYDALGLTGWEYGRMECDEPRLPALLSGLGPEWVGLSLTMPLKRVALTVADRASPLARAVGAANTLLLRPGGAGRDGVLADNTDVAGMVGALHEIGLEAAGQVVVVGAGGTAQAALACLRDLSAGTVTVLVRDPNRTAELRATADRLGVRVQISGDWPPTRPLATDLVISTLPGAGGDVLAAAGWVPGTALLDARYEGWPTPLARAAHAVGAPVASGLSLLLHQAVAQVRLMTGAEPPVEAMRAALHEALAAAHTVHDSAERR